MSKLPDLLQRVFGHRGFREHQQPVCEAAASGQDVLLVMPTGAGKSLWYPLPARARGGTALVISPLIALMDDQAAKLEALQLRVGRIHSGLPRESSREVCRRYLSGQLDFLFIAPERLRVPGFPEMLAKRKPALIAIDEAHCISAWGHDFRPDYRTLGQFLPALRPAPVIALTATATPTVQKDILRALNLQDPAVFITGFRRENLHIEATELSKPQRGAFIARLLGDARARPAIVYASSRKTAEEIASSLASRFPTAAYHAGLDAATRDRVQRSFLSGQLDVVVATVAFGMGVDKADVRTVIHSALPGSVEAYYQEIGRAGRDGKPSRAILLHGFADRRTQEFLMERSYPPVSDLCRILSSLQTEPGTADALQRRLKMDAESVSRAVEKLLAQGAAVLEPDGSLHPNGEGPWQDDYEAQVGHRREQIDRMISYAEGTGCRMSALVRHFGDVKGAARACGNCDSCSPQHATSSPSTQATGSEQEDLLSILHALKAGSRSTGKLFAEAAVTKDRKSFDRLLDGLSRAGLVHIATESFRADDGGDVPFKKASLTPEGRAPDQAALQTIWLRGGEHDADSSSQRGSKVKRGRSTSEDSPLSPAQIAVFEDLRRWRAGRAMAAGSPAFLIFGDAVLKAIASAKPSNLAALQAVSGVGPDKLEKYAVDVLAICRGEVPSSEPSQSEPEGASVVGTAPKLKSAVPRATIVSTSAVMRLSSPKVAMGRKETHPVDPDLDARLREWRRDEAGKAGLPTFFILSETALRKLAVTRPKTLDDLHTATELSAEKLARYGADLLAVCQGPIARTGHLLTENQEIVSL